MGVAKKLMSLKILQSPCFKKSFMKLSGGNQISLKLFIVAPLVSMVMPFVVTLFDSESKCLHIPLGTPGDTESEILAIVYFGIPLAAGIYGIYVLIKNNHSRLEKPRRFYTASALVILNLLSPPILYFWASVSFIILLAAGCYKFNIN